MRTIEEAIQQERFESANHRVHVNVVYTAGWLNQLTYQGLKPFGLSLQQFNILRILRGRGDQPSTIKLLTERMLDKMSNASRLVDKLKDKGFVERAECMEDRRRVDIRITPAGLDVVGRASEAIETMRGRAFASLSEEEAATLSYLLDKLRDRG